MAEIEGTIRYELTQHARDGRVQICAAFREWTKSMKCEVERRVVEVTQDEFGWRVQQRMHDRTNIPTPAAPNRKDARFPMLAVVGRPDRIPLERYFIPMLRGDWTPERQSLQRVSQRAKGGAIGGIAQVLDRLVVARIPARPLLRSCNKRRPGVDGARRAKLRENLTPVDPRVLARFDRAAEAGNRALHRLVQIQIAGALPTLRQPA